MARKNRTARPQSRPLGSLVQLEDRAVPALAFALSNNALIRFDTDNPQAAQTAVLLTGVAPGENLVGIDVRPQNGALYGVAVNATGGVRLYAISPQTGVATPLTAAPTQFTAADGTTTVTAIGTNFGVDFNPVADRLRVISDTGFNFRIDPNTGLIVDANGGVAGVQPDTPLGGEGIRGDGAAYTNNTPGAKATTLYVLDAATNKLFIQNDPNTGNLTNGVTVTLNGQPLDFAPANGFDIPIGVTVNNTNDPVGTGQGLAVLTANGTTGLYSIDLTNGKATLIGPVASGATPVQGFAVQGDLGGAPLVGLTADGLNLVRLTAGDPAQASAPIPVTKLNPGEALVGIDYRPTTGQLLGLGVNAAADTATLYVIDPQTGVATAIGTAGGVAFFTTGGTATDLPLPTAGYGFDVNPATDQVHVVTETGLNFRIDPTTGAGIDADAAAAKTNPDPNLAGAGGAGASGLAFTNSTAQAGPTKITTAYALDATTDKLFILNPQGAGTLTNAVAVTLDGKPLDFTAINGFDIPSSVAATGANAPATGEALASLTTTDGKTNLYAINLTTGAARVIGTVGGGNGTALAGLAAGEAPAGTVEFQATNVTVSEDKGTAFVTVTRTGGTAGPVTVTVAVTGGTATAGQDFTAPPTTLTFEAGQTEAKIAIPIIDDTLSEADETIQLTISAPTGGAVLGDQTTATVTIADNDPGPTVSISDATVFEGNAGTTQMTFTVSLSAASGQPVTVTIDTANGTAVAGQDFTAVAAKTITFAPGTTTQTVTVDVIGDTVPERDEAFALVLSGPTGKATLGDFIGFGTILNDDPFPPGTAPTISDIPNVATTVGTPIPAQTFTVGDAETPAEQLIVTATSSNPTLLPVSNITFSGTGANRTVTVTPVAGQTGVSTVTVSVTDASGQTTTDTFAVVVNPTATGTPPTISDVPNQTTPAGQAVGPITFTVGDAETPAANLIVTASSNNQTLVPTANIVLGGSGATRTVTVTPAAGQTGTAVITLVVTDANGLSAADTFTVNVGPVNTPPVISDISNQQTTVGTALSPIAFTVTDAETPNQVTVTATSSNQALVPTANITVTGTGANRTLTVTPAAGQAGASQITVTATDPSGATTTETFTFTVAPAGAFPLAKQFAVGADVGENVVQFYNPDKTLRFSLEPFGDFTGGVRVAAADFNNDGVADLVVGTGPGRTTQVRVLDGVTKAELFSIQPFESAFTGGVYVSAGDVTGDGRADLVITPDRGGGPRVRVFDGSNFSQLADFFGIEDPAFRGGARAAIADVNGDGTGDLLVAAGFLGGPRVAVWNGKTLPGNAPTRLFNDFFAFESTLRNGVFITGGDIDGDGKAEVIAGGGPGGGPRVTAFSAKDLLSSGGGTLTQVANFFGGDPNNRGGIRVTVKDLDGDAKADLIVGSGERAGSRVTGYLGANIPLGGTPTAVFDFDAFPGFTGGVFVG